MTKIPVITQPAEGEEVPAEIIAMAIVELAQAMKRLSATRLKREAIIALLHESSKLPRKTIALVLNNLESLEETWLKPNPKPRK